MAFSASAVMWIKPVLWTGVVGLISGWFIHFSAGANGESIKHVQVSINNDPHILSK